jgi:hypothetical protein
MRAYNAAARPQRLLWASTGTKDPKASNVLYVNTLAALFTVNTMPKGTLKALAEHGDVGTTLPADGGNSEEELARFADAKIDVHALSRQLQDEGAKSFVDGGSISKGGPIPCKSSIREQKSGRSKWARIVSSRRLLAGRELSLSGTDLSARLASGSRVAF